MSISGGGDRRELRPLRHDGNVDHDLAGRTVVGNHKGQYAGFNIVDPRPGTVHQWTTRREFLGCRQRGWWKATPEDGKPAYEIMGDYVSDRAHPADGSDSAFSEYIHVVTTEENYRRLTTEHLDASKAQMGPAELGFLENISESEYAMSRSERGRNLPTRFARKEHATWVQEGDQTIEHLGPQGILRQED